MKDARILVLAPAPRDASLIEAALGKTGVPIETCRGIEGLCRELAEGAAVVLIAGECLGVAARGKLVEVLSRQASWSDLPVVVFSGGETPLLGPDWSAEEGWLDALGNVVLLERPVTAVTLRSAVRAAIRARRRQAAAEQDLAQREVVEEALDKTEARFRAVQELSLDAFTFLSAVRSNTGKGNTGKGNPGEGEGGPIIDFRWEYVNPPAARLLHHTPVELVGRRLLEVLPPGPQRNEVFERCVQVIETGLTYDIEVHYESEGSSGWFRNAAVKLGEGVAIYYSDITDRKEAEETLRKSEESYRRLASELKELNETLEQRVAERTAEVERRSAMVRSLAVRLTQTEQRERRRLAQVLHDHLQQLLVATKFKVSLLKRRSDQAEIDPLFAQVEDLLNQSIDASRSLTVELSPPLLYDAGLVAALGWLAREIEQKHGLSVAVEADPTAEPAAEDTRILVFQAVRELLFNAVKHARTTHARVTLEKCPEGLRLEVVDQGVGFATGESAGEPGTSWGFGLLSIRERLQWIGGRLEIHSSPGAGTHAEVFVPHRAEPATAALEKTAASAKSRPAAPPKAPPRRPPRPRGSRTKIRVLVADDHELLREGLVSLLGELPDVKVVGAVSDGQAAVELALAVHPDVVMMDVVMPGLGGVEATRQIVARLPETRVIGLSMHEAGQMAQAMQEAGAVAYLQKDISSEALVAAIRQCAAGRLPAK
jgi:PAS domain S-box-containing protein